AAHRLVPPSSKNLARSPGTAGPGANLHVRARFSKAAPRARTGVAARGFLVLAKRQDTSDIREWDMAQNTQRVGWIGVGRMGYPMAERLLKAGYDVSIWNRTKSKAEPLAKSGGKVVDKLSDLSGCDIVFSIVAEGKDVEQVYFGKEGVLSTNKTPPVFVDCSTIAVEESA